MHLTSALLEDGLTFLLFHVALGLIVGHLRLLVVLPPLPGVIRAGHQADDDGGRDEHAVHLIPNDHLGRGEGGERQGGEGGHVGHKQTADDGASDSAWGRPSFAYEFEPRPVSRGVLTEAAADARSYRVELVMRRARQSAAAACVSVRLAANANETDAELGTACAASGRWETVVVGPAVRLPTARAHRLEVAASEGVVDVDRLRLVEVRGRA